MCERSILRLRTRPHIRPERSDETIVEVLRDGVVVASIFGSREGVNIVSERLRSNSDPFRFDVTGGAASIVLPLLSDDEPCPWCQSTQAKPDCMCCGQRGPE